MLEDQPCNIMADIAEFLQGFSQKFRRSDHKLGQVAGLNQVTVLQHVMPVDKENAVEAHASLGIHSLPMNNDLSGR